MAICAGQIKGPFHAGEELVTKIRDNEKAPLQRIFKIGISCSTRDILLINNNEFEIGKTAIFELDDIELSTLSFQNEKDGATFVTYLAERFS